MNELMYFLYLLVHKKVVWMQLIKLLKVVIRKINKLQLANNILGHILVPSSLRVASSTQMS